MRLPRIALGDPRAAAAGADGVPRAALAWRRVRARAGARAARRAGAHPGRHRAGSGDGAARPAAPLRGAARSHRTVCAPSAATNRQAMARASSGGNASASPGDRADHRGTVAHDGAHLGHRPRPATSWRAPDRSSRHPRKRPPNRFGARSLAGRPSAGCTRTCSSSRARISPTMSATSGSPHGRDVEGALAGILTTDRRPTSDGKAVIVSAAHPIWVGDDGEGRGGRRGNGQRGAGASATARSSGCSTSCSPCCWWARWR